MATYPVFLAFTRSAARLPAIRAELSLLHPHVNPSCVLGVDVHYRAETDSTLVGVRLDARSVTAPLLDRIRAVAEMAGGALIDPAQLEPAERHQLEQVYLPQYDEMVDFPGIDDALGVLARWLGGATPEPTPEPDGDDVVVHFRRGGSWQPARARDLCEGGAYLATGAPPRIGDLVSVRIQGQGRTLGLEGTVLHVTQPTAASALGAGGFGLRFREPLPEQRRELELVLAAARGSQVRAVPPPRRRDARYPVEIPVLGGTPGLPDLLVMLDISRRGMFLAADDPLPELGSQVAVLVPPESTSDGPIEVTGRVVRARPREAAERAGGVPGFGLEVTAFSRYGDRPYVDRVERIARRVERNVVVGAAGPRLGQLCSVLHAVGYSTHGFSDARELVISAVSSGRAPDAVVLDASLGDKVQVARRLLDRRAVHTLELDGESPAFCREMLDACLIASARDAAEG